MSAWPAWKRHEKKVAMLLHGRRHSRGNNYAEEAGDVEHPLFSVECKYRKKLPALLLQGLSQARRYSSKPPLLVLKEQGRQSELVVMSLADFVDLFGALQQPVSITGKEGV